MSTSRIAPSIGLAVLVLVSCLAVVGFRAASAGRECSLCDEFERRLSAVDEGTEAHLGRRAEARTARDDAALTEEPLAADSGVDLEAGETSKVDRLLARFDDFERRLKSLEEDPLLRGFSYIESSNPKLRRRGVRALKDIAAHDPEARDAIRQTLGDVDDKVRLEAIEALTAIKDPDAVPLLRGMLGDTAARVRREVIESLVDLKAKEEGGLIAALLNDADEKVREQAANALGKLKSSQGTDLLVQALHDSDRGVRTQAIQTLGRIGAMGALPVLREMYQSNATKEPIRLAKVLRKLGDAEPFDNQVFQLGKTALNDPDESVRYHAVRMLANHARTAAQDVFRQATSDVSRRVRKEAKKALRGRD